MADANYIPDDRIVSRKDAKALGLKRYFPGSKCKHGHVSERLTINGSCCECDANKRKIWYWNNREEDLRRQKIYRDAHPERLENAKQARRERDPLLASRVAEQDRVNALRNAAIAAGESRYFTGTPCAQGHIAPRFVKDRKCAECNKVACKARNDRKIEGNPDLLAARLARARAAEEKQIRMAEMAVRLYPYKLTRINRKLAFFHGLNTYYAFRPCRHGHVCMRYTDGGNCLQCSAEFAASEAKKTYDKEYVQKNYLRIKARADLYRVTHREQMALKSAEWRRKNPEKRRTIANNYKYKRRAQEESGVTSAELLAWKKAQKKICYWCGVKCPKKYHVDHYTPLSKGGKHEVENLVIACPTCNLTKNAKDPYEFAVEVGRLF